MIYIMARHAGLSGVKIGFVFAVERYQYKPGEGTYWTTMDNIKVVYSSLDPVETRETRRSMAFSGFEGKEMLNEKKLLKEIFK
jgi:hypothetical protein